LNDTIIVMLDNNASTKIGCPTTNGGFTCQFDVPGNAANGNHTFQAHGHVPPTDLTAIFKVAPGASLTLAPTSEHAGATAQVSGAGLQPNATLSLEFNHAPVAFGSLCQTNSTGSFANCSYTVPSLTAGTYAVSVFDGTSNPTANFTINPSASITVTDPIGPNSNLNISGSNFGAGKSLTFELDGIGINPAGGSVFTDANGNIPQFTSIFLVKETTLGQHTVKVTDGSNLATANFTVVSVITVNPQSGPVASAVTITGYGLAANQDVSATFAGLSLTGLCKTDASFSFSCAYTVPVVPSGPQTVKADAGSTSATTSFTITPSISLTSTSGVVGTPSTLNGTGFAANQSLSATLGAANITFTNSCITSANGTFSCSFAVPAAPSGSRPVQATDDSNNTASATFFINPSISLANNSGAVGSTTALNGFGFAGNQLMKATFSGIGVVFTSPCNSDGSGSFSCGITVPVAQVGQKTVQAEDALHNSASASFTITPSISLTKTSGTVGAANTLNGSGFGGNKRVDVTLGGVAITFDKSCNTDVNGSLSCAFTIPASPSGAGQKIVQATDTANNSASASFSYLASISLTNTAGNVGSNNTVNGTAFAANSSITATLSGVAITFTGPCNTDGAGSFSCPFTVPATMSGPKTVQVTDAAGNSASTNFGLNFSLSVANTSGPVGATNTLNGSGFFPSKSVTNASLGGIGLSFLGSCSTDGNGSFSCAFNVPAATAGLKDASATVSGLVFGLPVPMNGFLANAFTVMPSISLTSNSGAVGSANLLKGTGFGAAKTVTATLGAANISLTGPCATNGNGSFSCGFTVPAAPDGQQTVQATDASNSASTTFTVNAGPTAADGNISGRIANDDGTPVSGVVVRLSGTQTRKTITDSNGNYHFDNVETNGFYTVTPSRVNYNFSPFNSSFSLLENRSEATFTATSMGDGANPLDTPEYFIRQQYLDFLDREPDEGGFNYWSDRILACEGDADCIRSRRTGVSAAFFIEQEFQQSGSFIYSLYEGALGRRPAFAEYSTDRQQVVAGANLETNKTAFAQGFVGRAEFVQKYQAQTTAEGFVDALIQNVRQSTAVDLNDERETLIAAYNAGADQAQSRALAVRTVADNAVFRQANYNAAFVLTEYFGYLRRDPDQGGYDFWLNVLNSSDRDNYHAMVCSFVTSAEYQQRFSLVVSYNNAGCGQEVSEGFSTRQRLASLALDRNGR
jgi:hypothetical protein